MKFRDKILKAIDSAALQAKSLVNDFSDSIESIDINSGFDYIAGYKDSLIEKKNDLIKGLEDALEQIKNSITDFSVTVPFDEDLGEVLEYSVSGNKLLINVTFEDDTTKTDNKTVVGIPENCDVSKIKKVVNNVAKTATIVIPKKSEKKHKKFTSKAEPVRKPALKRDAKGRFIKKS
jgi:hypothetical protein